jgi:hypothetical protein
LPSREEVLQFYRQCELTPPNWFSENWTGGD